METLEKLFGSSARIKMMRLFIFNPDNIFDSKTIAKKTRVKSTTVRREVSLLSGSGLIKRKTNGYALNQGFELLQPLQHLLTFNGPIASEDLIKRIGKSGQVKLLVISGIFTEQWDGRVDLLIVGNKIRKGVLEGILRGVEAEVGKDLRYAALDTVDFTYRLGIGDKLIRDVFDYPHKVIFDKIGLSH